MAEPVSTMQVAQFAAVMPVNVETTSTPSASDTSQPGWVFTTLEAVAVRPPYSYGVVVG